MKRYKITLWAVRIILIALIVCHMSVIFGFSSDTGEQSKSFSDKITIQVVHIFRADYDTLKAADKTAYFNEVSFVVRKIGHFGEYAILGMLVSGFLLTFEKLRKQKHSSLFIIGLPAVLCLIYAATDEFHQKFVAGRRPKLFDVGVDTAGGIAGAAFVFIVYCFIRRRHDALGK